MKCQSQDHVVNIHNMLPTSFLVDRNESQTTESKRMTYPSDSCMGLLRQMIVDFAEEGVRVMVLTCALLLVAGASVTA
ncbi:MAG: hypothetical protein M3R15_18040, partial [Acidobacteriota bacterium]|nr:hypothetical protein [Acidobacteriota bacterium]